jgi:3-hydroxybutyryl-CoA dehydrogenase
MIVGTTQATNEGPNPAGNSRGKMLVGIAGTGTMAQGITRLLTMRGYRTVVRGRSSASSKCFLSCFSQWITRQVAKEKLSIQEGAACVERLTITQELNAFREVDYIIEAVAETVEVKQEVFRQLEGICSDRTPFASNTSSIPIEHISQEMRTRERFIGVHFMNPAYVMPLVEVIPSAWTDAVILAATLQFLADLHKEAVVVPDRPGFVLNQILFSAIQQAIRLLETEPLDAETIDAVMKLGANYPMGPLELADFIGLDVCLAILENLGRLEPEGFDPPGLLRKHVKERKLGRKVGEGFHRYDSQ